MSTYELTMLFSLLSDFIPVVGVGVLGLVLHQFWKTWLFARKDRNRPELEKMASKIEALESEVKTLKQSAAPDDLGRRIQVLEDIVTSDRYLQDTSRNP